MIKVPDTREARYKLERNSLTDMYLDNPVYTRWKAIQSTIRLVGQVSIHEDTWDQQLAVQLCNPTDLWSFPTLRVI